jgi:hypothetical protein
MTLSRCLQAARWAAAGMLLILPSGLSAQVQPPAEARSQSAIRCESTDGDYQRCPAQNSWRGARLVQQLSSNPCIQGRTWGFDRDAIWVNNGCRGVFDAGDRFTRPGERVTCAGSGRTECPADTRYGVTLVRKLSQAPCTQGSTWGFGDNVVWVDRGCRAEFEIGSAPESGAAATTTETVTCGATTGLQSTCRTGGYATAVRMVRDLSGGRCREGSTWGFTDSFIWANRGCRAQFEVTLRGEGTAAGPTGPAVISCGSTSGRQVVCDTEGEATAVRLQRDQSGGRCRQGQSWGFTSDFIWTNNGCRGEFEITYKGGSGDVATRSIVCGTADTQRLACRPGGDLRSAKLVRELSTGRCRADSTWGYGGDSLWVANGCVGQFTLGVSASAATGASRTLNCGSTTSDARMSCSTLGQAADVRLVLDLSGGRCRQNQSWGYTASAIWTSGGCRARFQVTYVGRQQN